MHVCIVSLVSGVRVSVMARPQRAAAHRAAGNGGTRPAASRGGGKWRPRHLITNNGTSERESGGQALVCGLCVLAPSGHALGARSLLLLQTRRAANSFYICLLDSLAERTYSPVVGGAAAPPCTMGSSAYGHR